MDLQSLYKIHDIKVDGTEFSAGITFDPDHAILKGHFPGHPVVPGVCLIRIMRDLVSEIKGKPLTLHTISNLKFLKMIDPYSHAKVEVSGSYSNTENGLYVVNASITYEDVSFLKFKGRFH